MVANVFGVTIAAEHSVTTATVLYIMVVVIHYVIVAIIN